jgi:hypothetical protein
LSSPNNLKATGDSAVSLLTLLHQLLLLIPEGAQSQKKNGKSSKTNRKMLASEKTVDGLHDENELICFGL